MRIFSKIAFDAVFDSFVKKRQKFKNHEKTRNSRFSSKITFFAKNAILSKNLIFGQKSDFWSKMSFSENDIFGHFLSFKKMTIFEHFFEPIQNFNRHISLFYKFGFKKTAQKCKFFKICRILEKSFQDSGKIARF